MPLQADILDFVKRTTSSGYGWMGLPSLQNEPGGIWLHKQAGGSSIFSRFLPGIAFDSGLAANNTLLFAQNYVIAILLTPFDVVETLSEMQFQPRLETIKNGSSTKAHAWFGKKEDNYLPLLRGGTWESIREIMESPRGGVTMLIKGHFTNLIYRSLYSRIQNFLAETLNDGFNVYRQINPYTLLFSHLSASFILYPIDVIKTCLMLQSSMSKKKTYQGPIHMLYSAIRHSAKKFLGIYHPRLCLFPVFVNALGPPLQYLSEIAISRLFKLNPHSGGVLYYVARVAFIALEAVILSPLHLVKRRMMVQSVIKPIDSTSGESKQTILRSSSISSRDESLSLFDIHPSVFLYPEGYSGVIDCLIKVISLEGNCHHSMPATEVTPLRYNLNRRINSARSAQNKDEMDTRSKKNLSSSGINSIFRGFWCTYFNRIILFSLNELNKNPEPFPWLNS